MTVTATKLMEERYTLQVLLDMDATQGAVGPGALASVNIAADKEEPWLERLAFTPGVAATKYAQELCQQNVFDVLAVIGTFDEDYDPSVFVDVDVGIFQIDYDPTQLAGSRITISFAVSYPGVQPNGDDPKVLAIVTLGLSHSINR